MAFVAAVVCFTALYPGSIFAFPHGGHSHQPVIPKVKGTPQLLGLVMDHRYDRDSCGSADFGDRTFWTCRDTQLFYKNGSVQVNPVITSTASYTNLHEDRTPALQHLPSNVSPLNATVLRQYGNDSTQQAFFPVLKDECEPPSGSCTNGSRFALWPDSPPMVAETQSDGSLTAYTWIRKSLITSTLASLDPNPATTLYRTDYNPEQDRGSKLPSVSVIDEEFWGENEISFGNYGNVVRHEVAYLYGQANGTVYLAKAPTGSIEDKSQYKYFVNGRWTSEKPSIGQASAGIANASAGGQGTYYYSEPWQSYVWIGGVNAPGANFYITTAPEPQGPWIQPFQFYTGVNGDYALSAYSIQANPALTNNAWNNSIFVTYTKNDLDAQGINVYTTPLVFVEWE